MIKRLAWTVFLTCGALALVCIPSFADTIGPNNCGSCLGNSYTLTMTNLVDNGNGTSNLDITLVINSSGFNAFAPGNTGVGDLISVAPKLVSSDSSFVSKPTLLMAPGGTGNWTTALGGESASGCTGVLDGFFCSQANFGSETDADLGGTLTFEWSATVKNGTLLTGTLGSHIKALFGCEDGTTENCRANPQTSEDITLQTGGGGDQSVPEPSSLILLGSGTGVLGMITRRKGRQTLGVNCKETA